LVLFRNISDPECEEANPELSLGGGGGHPRPMKSHPEAMEGHTGVVDTLHRPLKAQPEALVAHNGAMEPQRLFLETGVATQDQ
jgi:hypothetical protein